MLILKAIVFSQPLRLAERLIREGHSIPDVAKLLKVHRATLYRALAVTA